MSFENVKINKDRIINVIKTSLSARDQNQGLFENISPPEADFISLIKSYGDTIDDDKFALHSLFLTTTMIHGDSTELLFKRITNSELLETYSWIFNPQKVVSSNTNEVIDACTKFFRPGGYNATAFKQWQHNCRIIENNYHGDLKNFFEKYNNDAPKIVEALVVSPSAKTTRKPEFRRFGPKLSRLLIQWLNQYDFYKLENTNSICIPVDFHVCRVMLQTSGVEIDQPVNVAHLTNKVLLPTFSEIIDENCFSARQVSEAIWFIGSNGCNKGRCDLCPLDSYCDFLMPRTSYDLSGIFDLKDIRPRPLFNKNQQLSV